MAEQRPARGPAPRALLAAGLLMALLTFGCVCPAFTATRSKHLSSEPDRQAAADLLGELEAAGVSTQGMALYVLPFKGEDRQVALALLDAGDGFRFQNLGQQDALVDLLERLAGTEAASTYHIGRVAVEYRDEDGTSVLALTASTEAVQRFARGEMDREAFMQAVEGRVDLGSLAGEVLE